MWVQQVKKVDKKTEAKFTFRPKGIGLNKVFSIKYDVCVGDFCSLFFSEDGSKIGMRFSKDKKDNSFTVGADGGANRGNANSSLFIACGRLLQSNSIYRILCEDRDSFDIYQNTKEDMFYINILGKFVYDTKTRDVAENEKGVYRYLSDGEIVYIGQGDIRCRVNSQDREKWVYDTIEYMLVDNKDNRLQIEADNINLFMSTSGRLPIYNRIKGKKL